MRAITAWGEFGRYRGLKQRPGRPRPSLRQRTLQGDFIMFTVDHSSRTAICILAATLIGVGGFVGGASSPARDADVAASTK